MSRMSRDGSRVRCLVLSGVVGAALALAGCSPEPSIAPRSQGAPGATSVPPAVPPAVTLARGDSGPEVRALYGYLNHYGYFPSDELTALGFTPILDRAPADPGVYDDT